MQLQKILYVFGQRKIKEVGSGFYAFRPYHYGPFDGQVYSDADYLASHGLLTIDSSMGRTLRRYSLTEEGKAFARALKQPYSGARSYMKKVVDWAQSLTFSELVRSVYEAFPHMRENSVFREPV